MGAFQLPFLLPEYEHRGTVQIACNMAPAHTSSQLTWLLVKDWNCFQRKGLHGTIFSAEPGNIYNKHSYKYSGDCRVAALVRCVPYLR